MSISPTFRCYLFQARFIALATSLSASLILSAGVQAAEFIERVSSSADAPEFNNNSSEPFVSASGRFVAFVSNATNIEPGNNSRRQIYLTQRLSGDVRRVSVDAMGAAGNSDSVQPSVSSDGRFVAFASQSTNFSSMDSDSALDIYLHDMATQTTQLISKASNGSSAGNGSSSLPVISADGRFVVFSSTADNLVADDTNGLSDVFIANRETGDVSLVSAGLGGAASNGRSVAPDVSANGRFVSFLSLASNLIADDLDSRQDAFVSDQSTGSITRANTTASGGPGGASVTAASISLDGSTVAFFALGTGLVPGVGGRDIYLKTLSTGDIQALNVSDFADTGANIQVESISLDSQGCNVSYDLATRDVQSAVLDISVHVYNCQSGNTRSITQTPVSDDDIAANNLSLNPSIDSVGRNLVFSTLASNLGTPDTNALNDVYLLDAGEPCGVDRAELRRVLKDTLWAMLSLPCEPAPQSATVEAIFDELDINDLDTTWALFTFTSQGPDANQYVRATGDTVLKAGQGFWIRQDTGTDVEIRMPAQSNEIVVDTLSAVCAAGTACYGIELSGDRALTPWNMVGNPYSESTAFDQVRVTAPAGSCADTDGCSITQALDVTQANLLRAPFFSWDDTAVVPDYRNFEAGGQLDVWSAAWMFERGDAEGNAPTVVLAK